MVDTNQRAFQKMDSHYPVKGQNGFRKVNLVGKQEEKDTGSGSASAGTSGSSSSSSSKPKRDSRTCGCLNPDRCKAIQLEYLELGMIERVGGTYFSVSGTSSEDSKYSI